MSRPSDDSPSAWFVAKQSGHWAEALLSSCAAFADEHGLLHQFRAKFAGIRSIDLTPHRAASEARSVSSSIWAIAHELVVARYLERVLGWSFAEYEPLGYKSLRGDWEFTTTAGARVFVEVKTIDEPEPIATSGVYSRGIASRRIRNVVKTAYRQLPDDDRATLVVLAGREILAISHGIMLGDVFQTLFGQFQVRFKPFETDPDYRAGPSFRDMLVHGTKHRRLGTVAGLCISGLDIPYLRFYAIDNPYARATVRLRESDLAPVARFFVDMIGKGVEERGLSLEDAWARMRPQSPDAV